MKKLLLVDDHDLMRKGIASVISECETPYQIFEANNGNSAISIASKETPDIIIMDVGLKSEDGIEVSKKILELNPEQKIIVLTVYSEIDIILRALDAGVRGYVLKDSIYLELLIAIEKVSRGKIYLCENSFTTYTRYKNIKEKNELNLLTNHEKNIFVMIAKGESLKNIATNMGISEKTVSVHKGNIMRKLGFSNLSELIVFATRKGLI